MRGASELSDQASASGAELNAFAGEVASRSRSAIRRPGWLATTLRIGFVAGEVPALFVFAVYFAQHRTLPLPWVQLFSQLVLYGPMVGILITVAVRSAIAGSDRIARAGYGLVVIANPITASTAAAAIVGTLPGAVGVHVFGAVAGPFAGTAMVCTAFLAGSMLVAIPLARAAGRDHVVIAAAVGAAIAVPAALAAVLAPIVTAHAFDAIYGDAPTAGFAFHATLAEHRLAIGAVAGAIGCSLLGLHIGLVLAFARLFARFRSGSRRVRSSSGS